MLSCHGFVVIVYYETQLPLPRNLWINVRQEPFIASNDLFKRLHLNGAPSSCSWVEMELVDAFSKEPRKAPPANFICYLANRV